jgi:Ras-related protein Rab-6A
MGDGDQATTFLSIRYKVVFIGNPTAGKTSLLNRICHDKFIQNYDSTIGVDFFTKTIFYNESIFKIQLWDSAGQEKYRALIPS